MSEQHLSQKNELATMGATCGVSPDDAHKLFAQGITTDTAKRAEMHGINLLQILVWVNTYGPMVATFLNDLLAKLKQDPAVMTDKPKA